MGQFYGEIMDYEKMNKCFLIAFSLGDYEAIAHLGIYYLKIEKNYILAKDYLYQAICHGQDMALFHLGYYYQHIEKNNKEMEKYYLMAFEKGDQNAILYYQNYLRNLVK
jgi:TPR repeat protein